MLENETGKKLKCLRSDNGGEYCSHEFEYYCSTNGIHRHKIVPRTPQENGVAHTHEQDYNGACKKHEVACMVVLKHVGGGSQYYYTFD